MALSQASRWKLFLLLLRAGPAGLTRAGVNEQLGLRSTAISAHLRVLEHAGLVRVVEGSRNLGGNWGEGGATLSIDYEGLGSFVKMAASELREHAPDMLAGALTRPHRQA